MFSNKHLRCHLPHLPYSSVPPSWGQLGVPARCPHCWTLFPVRNRGLAPALWQANGITCAKEFLSPQPSGVPSLTSEMWAPGWALAPCCCTGRRCWWAGKDFQPRDGCREDQPSNPCQTADADIFPLNSQSPATSSPAARPRRAQDREGWDTKPGDLGKAPSPAGSTGQGRLSLAGISQGST